MTSDKFKYVPCPECGLPALEGTEYCENALCENADGESFSVQAMRFAKRMQTSDFAVGDSFWLGGIELKVTSQGVRSICITWAYWN